MSDRTVSTHKAPAAIGPYVQAVKCDGWLYCSGQIPLDADTGEMETGDITAQTTKVLSNLVAVLEAAGCSVRDVVKTSVFLTDLGDFAAMNEVYAGVFGTDAPPARACVQVAALPKGCDVEIDCIAKLPA